MDLGLGCRGLVPGLEKSGITSQPGDSRTGRSLSHSITKRLPSHSGARGEPH